ncbi:MAG TPA: BON domain-containing protein [Ktedonobacterales bacterium]
MTTLQTPVRTDRQLQEDVIEELSWNPQVHPNEVGISVQDGIVTLSGWVDSYAKRWAAERAALRVRGVRAVANDLLVKLPVTAERTDADLARIVVERLVWDASIPSQEIQVAVSRGWVTLAGLVENEFQRQAAARAIRHLAGIAGVTNQLGVRKSAPVAADVKLRIERALVRNAETDASKIKVEIVQHRVTLRGTVRSWAERRAAEASARWAPGITEVDNQIEVRP